MKKIVLGLLMSLVAMSSQAQCDFSGITFEKFAQQGNEQYFRTNMDMDDCWRYYFTAYDYQLKKIDTLEDWGGRTGVAFYAKGKYQMRLNVSNICKKCDTMLTLEVDITVFGEVKLSAKPATKNCRMYDFEMTDFNDTCVEYYHVVWKSDDYIKSLTDSQWNNVSYVELYQKYSWQDYETYNEVSTRTWKHEFADSGRYLVTTTYLNKCTGIDTFTIHKFNVCEAFKTINIKQITRKEPITVIGYYDLLGRQVDALEPNKIYVVFYSNGHRQKVMRTE